MPTDDTPTDYVDRVLREAMSAATGGLDPAAAEEALTNAVKAIAKQMAALEATNYKDMSPDQVARAVAHTTKASDVLFCLVEFARGSPTVGRTWVRSGCARSATSSCAQCSAGSRSASRRQERRRWAADRRDEGVTESNS